MRTITRILALSFLGHALWVQAVQAGLAIAETVERIKEKITTERSYELGTEIEVLLSRGSAARLNCGDNSCGLKEILLYPGSTFFSHYGISTEGKLIYGGGDLISDLSSDRVNLEPFLVAQARWEIKDNEILITYRVESDEKKLEQDFPHYASLRKPVPFPFTHQDLGTMEFVQEIRDKVTAQRAYTMGTEIDFVLEKGQAIRLDPGKNPFGLEEILFYFIPGELYYQNVWKSGDVTGDLFLIPGGFPSTYKQYGNAPTVAQMIRWECEGDKVRVHHFYEADPRESQQTRKAFRTTLQRSLEQRRMDETSNLLASLRTLKWDDEREIADIPILMDEPDNPQLVALRTKYKLDEVVSSATDDYEKLRLLVKWAHDRWAHHGDNKPSGPDPLTILKEAAEGKRFRCVEYARVVAAAARAMGMPSRVLSLKREDVETASSGAGHVVAEIWLDQYKNWVFADAQWDVIPELNGRPLNAFEFQRALARNRSELVCSSSSRIREDEYIRWVTPLLFYFDFNIEQRFYSEETDAERISAPRGKVMLVPVGVRKPKVFQRKFPLRNCYYISNPNAFYPAMADRIVSD